MEQCLFFSRGKIGLVYSNTIFCVFRDSKLVFVLILKNFFRFFRFLSLFFFVLYQKISCFLFFELCFAFFLYCASIMLGQIMFFFCVVFVLRLDHVLPNDFMFCVVLCIAPRSCWASFLCCCCIAPRSFRTKCTKCFSMLLILLEYPPPNSRRFLFQMFFFLFFDASSHGFAFFILSIVSGFVQARIDCFLKYNLCLELRCITV